MSEGKTTMTTDAGRPVGDNQNSLTVGPRGPVVFEDFLLFEKMAHFNRERIPERVVHAKGSGAHGHFVCTNPDMAKYTIAKLFSGKGKNTRERPKMVSGTVDRHNHRDENDYYTQPGNLFRLMPKDAQQRLINNIVGSLKETPRRIQELQLQHFYKADPAYGAGVAKGLGIDISKITALEEKLVPAD